MPERELSPEKKAKMEELRVEILERIKQIPEEPPRRALDSGGQMGEELTKVINEYRERLKKIREE